MAGPSRYSESPNYHPESSDAPNHEYRLDRVGARTVGRLNDYEQYRADQKEQFIRDLTRLTPGRYNYEIRPSIYLKEAEEQIRLLEEHLRLTNMYLEKKRAESSVQRRSRSPRSRCDDDEKYRDRDREGYRRGSNNLASYQKKY